MHLAMGHGAHNTGLVDQTIDTSVIAYRQQAQEPPKSGNDQPGKEEGDKKEEKKEFVSKNVIYNSMERGPLYHAFAWLWCGCFEPKYKITGEYVVGEEWQGCIRVTDSMAYENVADVTRVQPCCLAIVSCCPLCPCITDMANIVLLGGDDSHKEGWTLKRIHRSQEVYDVLVKTIQANNAAFRQGKNPGQQPQGGAQPAAQPAAAPAQNVGGH
jgi:hypothetical protein